MNKPFNAAKHTPELAELANLLLEGGVDFLNFAASLGYAYEETKSWPYRWLSLAMNSGIAAGASKELVRVLVLADFDAREVKYDAQEVNEYVDGLYANQKGIFDRDPDMYKTRSRFNFEKFWRNLSLPG